MIARDSNSNGSGHLTSSVTVAHTVVGVPTMGFTFVIDQSGDNVTGVTWNGVAMTQLIKHIRGATEFIYVYGVTNPTTGNVVASRSSSSNDIAIGNSAYTGASATTVVDSTGHTEHSQGTGTTILTNVITSADNCWIFLGASNGGSAVFSASTNASTVTVISTDVGKIFDTNSVVTPAGSFDMTITESADAQNVGTLAVAFAPITLPVVTTQATSSISGTTALGNGNITDIGGLSNDKRGFVYGFTTQSLPGNVAPGSSGYDTFFEDTGAFGTGAYTGFLTGLTPTSVYYIRAYSHNTSGYSYGSEVSFYSGYTGHIAFDAVATDTQGGPTGSFALTVGTGNNRVVVFMALGNRTVDSCAYNGAAMTQGPSGTSGGGTNKYSIWYVVNPTSGAHNVSFALSSAGSVTMSAMSFSGVSQSQPIGATTTHLVGPPSDTTNSTSITLQFPNSWIAELESADGDVTFTQSNYQDERSYADPSFSLDAATKAFTLVGSQTLGFTTSVGSALVNAIVELVDAASVGAGNLLEVF